MAKVYISGRISGLSKEDFERKFNQAALEIKDGGDEPINPLDVMPYHKDHTWEDYMEKDIAALLRCDMIFMLDNWGQSKGARIERAVAIELGIPVMYQNTP